MFLEFGCADDCEPEAAYPPFCTRSLKREAPRR